MPTVPALRRLRTLTVCLLAAAVLAGCAATAANRRTSELEQSVLLYLQSLRWGAPQNAAAMLKHRDGALPITDVALLKGLRVTTFEHSVGAKNEDSTEAVMNAMFEYYWEDSGSVQQVAQEGVWWYDAEAERWFLDAPSLPQFVR